MFQRHFKNPSREYSSWIILIDLYLRYFIANSTLSIKIYIIERRIRGIEQKNNDLKIRAWTIYDFLLAKTKCDDYRLQPVKRSC